LTCRELSARIQTEFDMTCRKSEVDLVRHGHGLRPPWAKNTEPLSLTHIQIRSRFAVVLERHSIFQLPWIISDESSFVLCPTRKKLYCFRRENSEYVFQKFNGYPVKFAMCGALAPGDRVP
jgi:hypothetical protein